MSNPKWTGTWPGEVHINRGQWGGVKVRFGGSDEDVPHLLVYDKDGNEAEIVLGTEDKNSLIKALSFKNIWERKGGILDQFRKEE